jgi:ATP-binding cassette, subfamily C (CFTR/MRP), member 1
LATQIAGLVFWTKTPITNVAIAAATLDVLCGLEIAILTTLEHNRTIRPSSLLSIYLLAAITSNAVQLRTLVLRHYLDSVVGLLSASIILKSILLVLEHWPKTPLSLEMETYGPEELAGVLSRIVFWWLNQVFLRGYRSILDPIDLPKLDRDLNSSELQVKIQKCWNASKWTVYHC